MRDQEMEKFWLEYTGGRLVFLMPICQGCGVKLRSGDISEPVLTASFVTPDEEGGYTNYMSFDEKCRFCGNVIHSFGDVGDATEEDYRICLKKRAQEEAL